MGPGIFSVLTSISLCGAPRVHAEHGRARGQDRFELRACRTNTRLVRCGKECRVYVVCNAAKATKSDAKPLVCTFVCAAIFRNGDVACDA
jgi:hypothetical protein